VRHPRATSLAVRPRSNPPICRRFIAWPRRKPVPDAARPLSIRAPDYLIEHMFPSLFTRLSTAALEVAEAMLAAGLDGDPPARHRTGHLHRRARREPGHPGARARRQGAHAHAVQPCTSPLTAAARRRDRPERRSPASAA